MHSKLEAHLKCVVIASYCQLCIAISRVPALENSIARAILSRSLRALDNMYI